MRNFTFIFICLIFISCTSNEEASIIVKDNTNYQDLVKLYKEFQEFQIIPLDNGMPDYSPNAVANRWGELKVFQEKLAAFNFSSWSISEKIDYHLVRAEMNGLEFQHRVVRPWSRDPSFYLQTQEGAGPTRYGALDLARLKLPLEGKELDDFVVKLKAVPKIFSYARKNLTEGAKDFATLALQHLNEEKAIFEELAVELKHHHPELVNDSKIAQKAVETFGFWLQKNIGKMKADAGVGKENYSWLMKNVYLFPYTWDEIRMIVELEDNRVRTFQRLEENRNRNLPSLKPAQSQAEYKQRVKNSIDHVMNFLVKEEIFTVDEFLTTEDYFGTWHNFDDPWPEKHDYFFNFSHREALMEETHEMVGHHFDELRARRNPHPIRGGIPPYKIGTARHEGFAFALEELMMHAGYLDGRSPRGREIAYEQSAFRTVRALSDIYMHSQDWDLEDAVKYCINNAPHGELLKDSHHLWYEMATTLRGTGHHMLMVLGKVQFMKLFRDRAHQMGEDFTLKAFMDEFIATGTIPFALTRWEMTGYDDEIKELTIE
tara:strand:+ start:356 stop:1987 length:1632 start_codon:yes stop_codon:yes gene_type:complete